MLDKLYQLILEHGERIFPYLEIRALHSTEGMDMKLRSLLINTAHVPWIKLLISALLGIAFAGLVN